MEKQDFNPSTCFKHQHPVSKIGDQYFDSYSHFSIHQEMLRDKVRTDTYFKAIISHPDKFKDKIVLDVGSGTGILSIFAVRAGAKHVYAIEKASIAQQSIQIIRKNKLQDRITVIQQLVEEVKLPEQVDILISQWMGYFLLYQSMLDSVILARDRWLKPSGEILPDRAVMTGVFIEDQDYYQNKIQFWKDVYGVDMTCIKEWALTEPLVDEINHRQICTNSSSFLELNLHTVKPADLAFSRSFTLQSLITQKVRALTVWFDCFFTNFGNRKLSTSPYKKTTHWKQTTFYLGDEPLEIGEGQSVEVRMAVSRRKSNERHLVIKLGVQHGDKTIIRHYQMD